jgi:hypothetical protein
LLQVEALEARLVPVTIQLTSADQFGVLIPTIQAYNGSPRVTFGILDTGSPSVTFSARDQTQFTGLGAPIPILAAGAASAGGIGGIVQGDVSQPGTIYVDGMHAGSHSTTLGSVTLAAGTPGIQALVGTSGGSPSLPTVTGTAIFNPSTTNPNGLAALVYLQAQATTGEPDVHFVSPGTGPNSPAGTTLVTIPLTMFGPDNYSDPGNQVTVAPVPVFPTSSLTANNSSASNEEFLFDTGSQVTLISPALAASLHLNLAQPATTAVIQGVGGMVTVPGFTVQSLSLGNSVTFTNVPVYVTSIGSGLDGVLGMNLLNHAASMLYNPYGQGGASLSVSFLPNTSPTGPGGGSTGGGTLTGTVGSGTMPTGAMPTGTMPSGTMPTGATGSGTAGNPGSGSTTPPYIVPPTMLGPHSFAFNPSISNLSATPSLQANYQLLIVLQAQPVAAVSAPSTGNLLTAGAASSHRVAMLPGHGAVFTPDNTRDVGVTTPGTSTSGLPGATVQPQTGTAIPDDETMTALSGSPEEGILAIFAAAPEMRDDTSAHSCADTSAADTIAKLAIVVAGVWGAGSQKQPERRTPAIVSRSRQQLQY